MGKPTRAILVALFALLAGLVPAAIASTGARVLHYRGRTIVVPAGWRVYDLARHPSMCVRLDRRAVYLGAPSRSERCPAHAAGRSRAIVIEPRGSRAVVLHGPMASAPSGGGSPGGSSLPAGGSAAGATFAGPGFDPCTAPSTTTMAAWLASPYRAIGIYLGGTNLACAQPNLTAAWVSQESAAGWHLIPTYVGLQAPVNSCGCAGISLGRAAAQGVGAANDAVARAAALGLGRGNPIYTDMEYYPRSATNGAAVLAYLSGWTAQLHAAGYLSGVYGNSDSVVADLLTREGTGYPEPDDIWFAEWNGVPTVSSPYIPSGFWIAHRLHQFSGGHDATYGGVTINIDSDALEGATAAAGSGAPRPKPPFPDGTFVQVSGRQPVYRIAGGAPLLVSDWTGFGGPQPYRVISARQFAALNRVPASGTFLSSVPSAPYGPNLFHVAGGAALPISNPALFPGRSSAVTVDQWDVLHPRNPLAHLAPYPADGTVVEGLPSRTYWVFQAGSRQTILPTATATRVDDVALTAFPMVPCLVPALRGLTLAGARAVLQAADCQLGTVRRRTQPKPHRFLHVVRQFPGPRASRPALQPVNVTLG